MDTTHNKDIGDKTWNNQQQNGDLNEGFSGENLPDDYNPAKHLKEKETDTEGNTRTVDRARNADRTSDEEGKWKESGTYKKNTVSDEKIEGKEDFNYDSPERENNLDRE